MVNPNFWKNKNVFITGHTGFKGSWLCLWLHSLGANVTGYSLKPPTSPSLFELCQLEQLIPTHYADIRDKETLEKAIHTTNPDIVIHMAAQPLVRASYLNPVETYATNVMGTIHLLEAVRLAVQQGAPIKAVVNVTTDKCYSNKEWPWGYRENDMLGGYDPYSNSKACSELVTDAYRNSFFQNSGVGLATARAGNVIGGGDWALDRLLPDCFRTLEAGGKIKIRNPQAIRPWQHVLDPLSGYLTLAENLYTQGTKFAEGWNFGPDDGDGKTVESIVKSICAKWGAGASYEVDSGPHPHEAHYLRLDCSKAKSSLSWFPRWNVEQAIDKSVEWYKAYQEKKDVQLFCFKQIQQYSNERA
jgi:CDP-glucose 4,6-dehydratase